MQMAESGPDDQEPLVPSVKHIGYKPANLENTKNAGDVNVMESRVSANKTGKHMDKNIEVEDEFGAPDTVATKSSDISIRGLGGVEGSEDTFKIAEIDTVAAKSLDISVGGLGGTSKIAKTDIVATKSLDLLVRGSRGVGSLEGATKSATTITKRWKTPTISGTRVLMTTNLNNPVLVSPPFTFPQLGSGMDTPMLASFVASCHRLGSLSSLSRAPRTTLRPQVPF